MRRVSPYTHFRRLISLHLGGLNPIPRLFLPRFKIAGLPGKKLTQKECQQQSDLGPKLFRRSVDLCRQAKDLNESQITFAYLVRKYGGDMALQFMDAIYKHFKKSCFDAGIVNDQTWDANHILVVCAVYCWTCDHVYPVSKRILYNFFAPTD